MANSAKADCRRRAYCPYCGVGCGLTVGVKNDRVVKVKGDKQHPSSLGMLCKKPIYLPGTLRTDDRLLYPQLRPFQDTPFTPVTWDQAINVIAGKFRQIIADHGPDAVAFYGSGQFSTEDYYVVNKLAKGFLGTNNFDANSRLCMASAVVGYATTLGSDGPPPAYADIDLADCFFLIGTNTAACHPVLFNRIKRRKKAHPDTTIIAVDPRKTRTARLADIHLAVRPGADVPLLQAMLHVLISENLIDEAFIAHHTDDFEATRAQALATPPELAARLCGVSPEQIVAAARAFGRAQGTLSFWSMGLNQSTNGVAKNQAVLNLHLATGKIGAPGNGPLSLTGQPNAMGGRETGGLSHLLPGYRSVKNPQHRAEVAAHWGISPGRISPEPGLAAVDMFKAAAKGKVKAIWIACTNPMVSMPNLDVVEAALRRAELVIVQDAYHPTDTGRLAHILLPAAQWSEKEGAMTNSERRITYLPQLVDPPGEALPDWQIFARFAQAMGFGAAFDYQNAAQVFAEFVELTAGRVCDYSGVSYERLQREGPLQWPVPHATHPGTERLYTDHQFPTPNKRARFHAPQYVMPKETPDDAYPLTLNTGRIADQWHTMTRTGKSEQLMKAYPDPFLEIHPHDARRFDIHDGDMVKISSRRGTASAKAIVTENARQGTVFMPFHWGRLSGHNRAANNLTTDAVDPVSLEPEFKACAVSVTPVWAVQWQEMIRVHAQQVGGQLPVAGD